MSLAALRALARELPSLAQLFAEDPSRATRYHFKLDDDFALHLAKQPLTDEILKVLVAFAEIQQVPQQRRAMFAGEKINSTEQRAVLHVALRAAAGDVYKVDGQDVVPEVLRERARLVALAEKIRGEKKITHVVHIGIGGSHLGPEMVVRALRPVCDGPQIRFVANVDPADLAAALHGLNPASTLFIVASKTFTTQETMANAHAARQWLTAKLGDAAVADHFVAASSNPDAAKAFGIAPEHVYPFNDWVGGRFSLWSSIGLPILLAIGPQNFEALLAGAREMDQHFLSAPLGQNLPVLQGLIGFWNRSILGHGALAVLPYAQDLALLPAFLQQLEMESNGKGVGRAGQPIAQSCPVVFGLPGSNGQHAFYQQLHQGPEIVPAEFIVPLAAAKEDEALAPGQHRLLVAHAFAQGAALLAGRKHADPHRSFSGNRPSSTLLLSALTPRSLGRLLAFYEHKVAVQGWLWDINSFDQFGVELGKQLAGQILANDTAAFDSSTQALLKTLT